MERSGFRRYRTAITASLWLGLASAQLSADTNRGLIVRFTPGAQSQVGDVTVLPNLALYVEATNSPSPFMLPGPFGAVWEGFLNVDLRSDYFFAAEVNGSFKLEINDAVVMGSVPGSNTVSLSKAVRLNKGANRLRATFTSPGSGDAFFRVGWTETGTNTSPIPATALSHAPSAELEKRRELHLGRQLFIEHRCANCHFKGGTKHATAMDGPSFEGIGSRLRREWMAQWIFDPKASRTNAAMPKLVEADSNDAVAMAAYLASLKGAARPPGNDQAFISSAGRELFGKLQCAACHTGPEGKDELAKLTLKNVADKFATAALTEFLLEPERHYSWIRMPNFKLTPTEAQQLTAFLSPATNDAPAEKPAPAELIEKGKKLVQTVGCLNCHGLPIENLHVAPKLTNFEKGCLVRERPKGSKAPDFGFSENETAALRRFCREGFESLRREAPTEFASRHIKLLNCNACHEQIPGLVPVELLGGRFRAEWMSKLMAGALPYKPRPEKHPSGEPWMEARMPAFPGYAQQVAEGMAALHGYPPRTVLAPADTRMAEVGRKLVGKDDGFSCISCHAAGSLKPMEVFEAEGINFIYSAERLLPDYYRRWMRNPLAIDPQTKMPVYFENGQSPLTDVLQGDAEKQIEAIWNYLRLADKMPPPATEPTQ